MLTLVYMFILQALKKEELLQVLRISPESALHSSLVSFWICNNQLLLLLLCVAIFYFNNGHFLFLSKIESIFISSMITLTCIYVTFIYISIT